VHLTALVQSPDHVCCRYRLAAFRTHLERAGHHLELRSFPRHPWSWLRLAQKLPPHSIVIIQRKLLPAWQLFLLRRQGRRLIFDFDDAVFLRDSYSRKGLHDPRRLHGFRRTIRACSAVVAGNDFLSEHATEFVRTECLPCVIPTCVDVTRYPLATHARSGAGVQLVWIGSSSTLNGVERIVPLLEEIGRRHPGLRLKLICDRFLTLKNLRVMECPWTEASEAAELAAADIGIAWVPDDLWSRGKCGLKVLQYMAAGLPVVGNPVGVQATMIGHGETGFHAETPEEWLDALGRLIEDAELRRRFGAAGRDVVEREYSVPAGAARWLRLLQSLEQRHKQAG
jgi:glycosyltransferase involved in cell wall biosynthesis